MVVVLPTDPVTAMTCAVLRARAAPPHRLKRSQRISHDQQRPGIAHGIVRARHNRNSGTSFQCIGGVLMPIGAIALDGNEDIAAADSTAVYRDPVKAAGYVAFKLSAGGFDNFSDGP